MHFQAIPETSLHPGLRVLLLRLEIDRLARPPYIEILGSVRKKEKCMAKAMLDLTQLLERVENDRELNTMKGMLSNLAANSAAGAAARLEQLGRNQEVSEFQAACASFENLSKELMLELDTRMAEVCG